MSDSKITKETVTTAADRVTSRVGTARRELSSLTRTWWLAGLGAVDETRSRGRQVLGRLVERGEDVVEARGDEEPTWRRPFARVAEQTTSLRDRIENELDETVGGFLRRAQVPTRDDLDGLYSQVERLTVAIEQLKTRSAAPAAKA